MARPQPAGSQSNRRSRRGAGAMSLGELATGCLRSGSHPGLSQATDLAGTQAPISVMLQPWPDSPAVDYSSSQTRYDLHPLPEAGRPPAPIEMRRALATIERVLCDWQSV